KPNPCSDPDNQIIFRRQPTKERLPHYYVLSGAGRAPWAPPEFPFPWQRACRWKIDRIYPLDWEKTLI
ncbi:MAG: hypothetical protein AMJ94_03065, partial [Deltaproteobacteria bacterium SM23_61]